VASSSVQISAPAPAPLAGTETVKKSWRRLRIQQEPFFDDKNRAFWILQSAGWGGYFLLHTLSGIANAMGWSFVIHTAILTGTGYSLTLLMAAAFRRLIRVKPLVTWAVSIMLVLLAAAAFSAIVTWSYATFLEPGRGRPASASSARSCSPSFC
jgi:hypothetical protein